MSFVVAYDVPHNDGVVQGIIDGPGFETGGEMVDLYEVDATIKSFATREEAEAWLAARRAEDGDEQGACILTEADILAGRDEDCTMHEHES